jgi:hypothetical protein
MKYNRFNFPFNKQTVFCPYERPCVRLFLLLLRSFNTNPAGHFFLYGGEADLGERVLAK